MAITLDPTKPPDTGESPTLGAQRIRNVSTFLLQVLGFTGTASTTLSVAPFTVSQNTGLVSLAGNGTTGTEPVVFQQFTSGTANGGTFFTFPGGLIVQFIHAANITSSTPISLPTSFTSQNSFVVLGTFAASGSSGLYISNTSNHTFTPVFTGVSPQTMSFIAVGN